MGHTCVISISLPWARTTSVLDKPHLYYPKKFASPPDPKDMVESMSMTLEEWHCLWDASPSDVWCPPTQLAAWGGSVLAHFHERLYTGKYINIRFDESLASATMLLFSAVKCILYRASALGCSLLHLLRHWPCEYCG